ncbi:hypothetical protein RFI_39613, partial [Reticulomyxa filosa]
AYQTLFGCSLGKEVTDVLLNSNHYDKKKNKSVDIIVGGLGKMLACFQTRFNDWDTFTARIGSISFRNGHKFIVSEAMQWELKEMKLKELFEPWKALKAATERMKQVREAIADGGDQDVVTQGRLYNLRHVSKVLQGNGKNELVLKINKDT